MIESQSVTNGIAMSVSGKIVHYAPLFASSKWWKKPITDLPDQGASKKALLTLFSAVKMCIKWWVMMFNRLMLGNLLIQDPIHMSPSFHIPIYTDASKAPIITYKEEQESIWSITP